ncbi:MAG: hypothetical protein IH577_03550 [Deltaproteobacteria bacterium]|nr:hypothetical protein [Deltaproteobacteria bacterium]
MAGITLAQAQEQLALALTALGKARQMASYSIGGQTVARQKVEACQADVDYWDKKCQELSGETNVARKIKVYGATPV